MVVGERGGRPRLSQRMGAAAQEALSPTVVKYNKNSGKISSSPTSSLNPSPIRRGPQNREARQLLRRLEEEERRQRTLQLQLREQERVVFDLRRSIETQNLSNAKTEQVATMAQRQNRRPMTSEPKPRRSDDLNLSPRTLASRALAALDDWLRLRNYRAIDIFRMCDINESATNTLDGDVMLDAREFQALLTRRLDLRLTLREVQSIVKVLDRDGNGEIDVQELDSALKQARRENLPKDRMQRIAARMRRDPFSSLISLHPRDAIQVLEREEREK